MTWRQLSMLIGQGSIAAFGAHLVQTEQITPTLGALIVMGIVVLAIIGGEGVAGGNVIVRGLRAWKRPPPSGPGSGQAGGAALVVLAVLAVAAVVVAILWAWGPEGGIVAGALALLGIEGARRARRDPSRDQAQAATAQANTGQAQAVTEAQTASDAGQASAAAVDGIPVPPPTHDALEAMLRRSRGEP